MQFAECRVRIETDARMHRAPGGPLLQVAIKVDYTSFMTWLTETIANGLDNTSTTPLQMAPTT